VFLEFSLSGLLVRLESLAQAKEAEHEVPIIVSRRSELDSEDIVINPSVTRCDSRLLIFRFPEISQSRYAVIILSMHGLQMAVDRVWGGGYGADGGKEGDYAGV